MATKLFLRNTANNAIGNYFDMVTTAGAASDTGVVNTAASGTEIQWTRTAGGTVLEFISGKAPAGGFTLAGTMTFSIWASESNMNANCGARARVFKRTAAGSESEVGGGPYNDGVEFTTADAEYSWTGTPTSTAFAENDRIIVRYYITNVGTMGGGFTSTLTYNAADATTGDSFFQITETVAFKSESTIIEADAASAGAATVSANSGAVAGSAGASDGVAATSGAGAALWPSAGSSTGAGAASGVGGYLLAGEGQSAGAAVATGLSNTIGAAAANSHGVGTATGAANAVSLAVAWSAGAASANANTAVVIGAVAATSGSSTAQADAENAGGGSNIVSADANSAGISTATGISSMIAIAVASGSGFGIALGLSPVPESLPDGGISLQNRPGKDHSSRQIHRSESRFSVKPNTRR